MCGSECLRRYGALRRVYKQEHVFGNWIAWHSVYFLAKGWKELNDDGMHKECNYNCWHCD